MSDEKIKVLAEMIVEHLENAPELEDAVIEMLTAKGRRIGDWRLNPAGSEAKQ